MTWKELVILEPDLAQVEKDIKAVKDDKKKRSFCANSVWFGYSERGLGGFKGRMHKLVGWEARGKAEELYTSQAYDLAYRHLYGLLPDCRNCECMVVA